MTSVLLLGDISFVRLVLRKRLSMQPNITVIGDMPNNNFSIEFIAKNKPDIILIDIDVPNLIGIGQIKSIMQHHPAATVIVLLNLTIGGAEVALKALEYGAVDFVHKESMLTEMDIQALDNALVAKIHQWGASNKKNLSHRGVLQSHDKYASAPKTSLDILQNTPPKLPKRPIDLVLIGISTGGPLTLLSVLSQIERLNCPMIIAQHMPQAFTKSLSIHLNHETGLNIIEGNHALPLEDGQIVIARGGIDSYVQRVAGQRLMLVEKKDSAQVIHPCVDVLFESAAQLQCNVLSIIMTGMGSDGLIGAKKLKDKNLIIVAQDPSTCIVSGMPASIIENNLATYILNPEEIGRLINNWCGAVRI